MTTLAAGSSVTLTLRDGGSVTVATNGGLGSAVTTALNGVPTTTNFGPDAQRRTFGPFSEGGTVVLSNSNCASFDYDTQGIMETGSIIQVLGKSAVAVSVPADTAEDVLATITIPAGAMGPNGFVRITSLWSCSNNANGKTIRVRFGGASYLAAAAASIASYYSQLVISNRGVPNSQVGPTSNGYPGGPFPVAAITSSVDTSAATVITLTAQKTTAGDTLTLESYVVELMYGA